MAEKMYVPEGFHGVNMPVRDEFHEKLKDLAWKKNKPKYRILDEILEDYLKDRVIEPRPK